MGWLIKAIALAAAIYVAIVFAAYVLQRWLTYFPTREPLPPPAAAGLADMEAVNLVTPEGLMLAAWFKPPPPAGRLILFFHGNAGSIVDRAFKARALIDAGFGLLLVEYRGFGGNPAKPGEAGLYADGRAALSFLTGRGLDPERIIPYGESLGSAVAVELASEHDFAALVLEAPFSSVTDVAAYHYPYLPVRLLLRDRFETIGKIGRVRSPILVVHGDRDRVVPVKFGRRLYDAAPEPKRFVLLQGVGHNDLFTDVALRAIVDFLQEHSS